MVSINNIKKYLKEKLSKDRYIHTLNMSELATKIAIYHKIKAIAKIRIASLLHDCEKNSKNGNNHSFLSSKMAKHKFCITDRKILDAIKYHTFGHRNMDIISKIIYISDMSEQSRKFKEAEQIRKLAFKNLDEAMLLAISTKLKYVIQDRKPVSLEGVILYNKLIKT